MLAACQVRYRPWVVVVAAVAAEVTKLLEALQLATGTSYLAPAQRLYDWFVRPYEPALRAAGVDTLVFVPDGALRTIPMAALHDGEDFLVRRYNLAVTPGLALTDPQPLDREAPKLLLAGLSESVQGFAALQHVEQELRSIEDIFGGQVLLNDGFTSSSFDSRIEGEEFSIVHIASHGTFSGNADQSFILTYDGQISINELADLVRRTRFRDVPLEMLVLSACETASGDEQAALGLAGIAIKAGARSAVGSLWQIDDEATSTLMAQFYRELSDPRSSRAGALRMAQTMLLENDQFNHPFYWSPFLLISNWL